MAQVVFKTGFLDCPLCNVIYHNNPIAKFPTQYRKTQHSYGDDCHWSAVSQPGIDCNHGIVNLLPDYRKNPKILFQKMQQYHHLGPQIKCPKLKKKPTGLAGGSSQAGITLIVPANALRAYDGLTGRRLLATRKRVKIHC